MLALEVVSLPVTDIDRALAFRLVSPSMSTTGPPPTFELFNSHRPDRHVQYNWSVLTRLTGCTTSTSSRPTSRTPGRH